MLITWIFVAISLFVMVFGIYEGMFYPVPQVGPLTQITYSLLDAWYSFFSWWLEPWGWDVAPNLLRVVILEAFAVMGWLIWKSSKVEK